MKKGKDNKVKKNCLKNILKILHNIAHEDFRGHRTSHYFRNIDLMQVTMGRRSTA